MALAEKYKHKDSRKSQETQRKARNIIVARKGQSCNRKSHTKNKFKYL